MHIGHKDMVEDLNMLTPSVFSSSVTLPGSERKPAVLSVLIIIQHIPYVRVFVPPKSPLQVAPNSRVCGCITYMFLNEVRRKKERSKQGQTNKQGKATQHTQAVTFPRKNELPQVGVEPTTLYTLDRALYELNYRGSSAGWAQISHLIVHLMNRLTINSV